MNVLKKDWKPDLGIRHVLVVIRCLLIEPFPESALNEEAGKLLLDDYEDYAKHARLMTSIHAQPVKRCSSSLKHIVDCFWSTKTTIHCKEHNVESVNKGPFWGTTGLS